MHSFDLIRFVTLFVFLQITSNRSTQVFWFLVRFAIAFKLKCIVCPQNYNSNLKDDTWSIVLYSAILRLGLFSYMNWQGSYSTSYVKKNASGSGFLYPFLYKSFALYKIKFAFEAAMIEICRSHLVAAFPSTMDCLSFILCCVCERIWTFRVTVCVESKSRNVDSLKFRPNPITIDSSRSGKSSPGKPDGTFTRDKQRLFLGLFYYLEHAQHVFQRSMPADVYRFPWTRAHVCNAWFHWNRKTVGRNGSDRRSVKVYSFTPWRHFPNTWFRAFGCCQSVQLANLDPRKQYTRTVTIYLGYVSWCKPCKP